MRRFRPTAALSLVALAACGEPDPFALDMGPFDVWTPLIEASWTLGPGEELEVCATDTLDRPIMIGGFRPIADGAMHHMTVTYDDPDGTDRAPHICQAGDDNRVWLFAASLGTGEFRFDTGVGLPIVSGKQVQLTVHLVNATDAEMTARTGVEVFAVPATTVENRAEIMMPGPVGFIDAPATLSSDCTLDRDQTIVAILPHMHAKGRYFRSELLRAGLSIATLFDGAFQVESQEIVPSDVSAQAGDVLRTTCTWDATMGPISFGEYSYDEMCYSIITRYPQTGGEHFCWE